MEITLKHMGPMKSLGPDGFGACFYQKYWDIVRDDMCATVLIVLNGDGMISSFNSTLIALELKKCNLSFVNEFRLINICNVV